MKKNVAPLCLFLFSSASIAIPLKTDIAAGYIYDDNVTRAKLDRDIEADNVVNVDGNMAYKLSLDDNSYFSLDASLQFFHYLDFAKLGNTRVGVHGAYHIRPFSGYTASRFFLRLSYIERLYQSDQRDGSATEVALGFSKRLTDVLSLRAGYTRQAISAGSKVFDADNNRYYLDAEFRAGKANTLYATLGYIDGDVVSTTVPTQAIIDASKGNIVRDDAFLDLAPPRFAYKLAAKTTTFVIGDSYRISTRQGIDGSLLYYRSDAYGGNDYNGMVLNLGYRYRF